MKKVRICLAFCMMLTLLFSACGTAQTGTQPTSAPKLTEAPEVTKVPEATEVPEVTVPVENAEEINETPTATEVPVTTEAPKATEEAMVTEAPEVTKTPKATVTPRPIVTFKPTVTSYPVASTKRGDIVYELDELTVLNTMNASVKAGREDGLMLQYDEQWGEVRLLFPEGVDLKECMYISLKMNTQGNIMMFQFYDEQILKNSYVDPIEVRYYCVNEETDNYVIFPSSKGTVYAVGISASEEVTTDKEYSAIAYDVTFAMASGIVKEVSKEIAPDVTENMTLLNTYGTVFDRIGVATSLEALRNKTFLELLKTRYNSVTSEWQAKLDQLMYDTPTVISVEEAKKEGYVIPENYKEAVVPKLRFDVLDETLKICAENDLGYRFHTLVWHAQAVDWFFRTEYTYGTEFVSPEVMDARLEYYIRNVMGHVYDSPYGHVVYAWDVANEYLHFDNIDTINWRGVYGEVNLKPDFLKLAFEVADDVLRQYGIREEVSLVLNDYHAYSFDEWYSFGMEDGSMPKAMIAVINHINSDRKVCDGVGMQSHLDSDPNSSTVEDYRKALQMYTEAGLEIQMTEMDVNIDFVGTKESQEERYVDILKVILEAKRNGADITGITLWEMADSVSANGYLIPSLFYTPGQPKDVYYKVLQTYLNEGYKAE